MEKNGQAVSVTLTSPFVLNAFLLGHIRRLSQNFLVSVYVNRKESDIPIKLAEGAELCHVEIRRKISPLHDIHALFCLWKNYRKNKIVVAVSVTPKGGLLGVAAAALAGIPVRIHWFTGQVWANKTGLVRWVFKQIDKCIARLATDLLADSASQKEFLISEGIVSANKIQVLGRGSISGVNTNRFKPNDEIRDRVRKSLGIESTHVCILYVGRMKKEKGTADLLDAFRILSQKNSNIHLLFVGPDEEHILDGFSFPNIHSVGFTKCVEEYMVAGDVFCLPSHREGFGSVLIEAGACGLPSVASRIYGITDAVEDGETGLLHEPGNPQDLSMVLQLLIGNQGLRKSMGQKSRVRACHDFESSIIENMFADFVARKSEQTRRKLSCSSKD